LGSCFIVIFLYMSKKEIFWGLVFLIVVHIGIVAQEKPQILTNLVQNDGQSGQIEIIQPEQVENLLKMKIANNRLQKGIPGYRLQIFSGSGQSAKQKSNDTRVNFMRNFPELETYEVYNTPNWQIFVGNFRTKNDALREMQKIKKIFPGTFIVSDIINISK